MNFYRHNWYYIGGVIFVVLAFITAIFGRGWDMLLLIMVLSWMALLVHQFEEYGVPGGFPAVFNIAVLGERDVPERYPLNANQCLVTNVFLAYPLYLAGIIWSNVIWLGLLITLFGAMQLIVHGFVINIRVKSFYNAGLGSTVALFVPIAIWYWSYAAATYTPAWFVYVIAVVGAIVGAVVTIVVPMVTMRDKKSPYPFTEREMGGFGAAKVFAMISAAHNSR